MNRRAPTVTWEAWRLVGIEPDGALQFHRDGVTKTESDDSTYRYGQITTQRTLIEETKLHSHAVVPAEIVALIKEYQG